MDAELLHTVDAHVKKSKSGLSRNSVIEQALHVWKQAMRDQFDAKYYAENAGALKEDAEPWSFIQDSSFYNFLFKNRRQSFVDRQFNALSRAAELCRKHGTKLLCVEVPWYPDVDMTPEFRKEYKSKIADVCKRYGAEYYNPAADVAFDYGEFLEPVHMNALGGEKYFWLTGKFIAKHKDTLLR